MADKRVDVLTRFRADSGPLDRSIRRSALYAKNLNDRINSIAGSVLRMAGVAAGVAGFGGIGYAVTKSAKSMVQLNRELETAKISIATVLQQRSAGGKGPFEGWQTALKGSADTIRELEKRAAALPGTTDEFRRGFELVLPITTRAGKSINDTIALAEKLVVQAKVGNVYGGVETVARDVQQILSGSASLAEINTIALKGRAKEIAAIARTDQGKALREIEKVLRVGDSALMAFAGTFETQASTMQDSITRFVRTAGAPVFEWAKDQLAEWNAWLTKNDERVKSIAKTIGDGVVKGIKTAGEWARKLYDRWDDIKGVVRTIAEVWLANRMVSAVGKIIAIVEGAGGLAGAIKSVGSLIKGWLGPIALVTAGFEIMRMMIADPLGDRAKELGLTVVRGEDIRKDFAAGKMSKDKEAFFRNKLPKLSEQQRVTMRKVGQDFEPVITGGSASVTDSDLLRVAQEYEQRQQRFVGAILRPLKGAAKLQANLGGGIGAAVSKLGPKTLDLLNKAFDAERPPNVDARGSTFNFNQKFEEGDPERIFFEIRSALVKPFIPRLGSTLAPS